MAQSPAWVILSARYGGDTRTPSDNDLTQAVNELFDEDIEWITEKGYAEHPNAWLRYGFDEGPVFVADASRYKTVSLPHACRGPTYVDSDARYLASERVHWPETGVREILQ